MKSIERFSALLECATEESWKKSIFQIGKDYGFEKALIAVVPEWPTSLGKAFLRSNYSDQWRCHYDSRQLINIDPTVSHCITRSTPLIWEPAIFADKKQKEMYEEASGYGLRSGLTLPYHGVNGELGILCFVNDTKPSKRSNRDIFHFLPTLSLMRDFAFEASLRFAKPSMRMTAPSLTKREIECLKWCADGKTSTEIAQIFCCSVSAVDFHFENLRRKFHATSRRQVLVKAIRCGLIHP